MPAPAPRNGWVHLHPGTLALEIVKRLGHQRLVIFIDSRSSYRENMVNCSVATPLMRLGCSPRNRARRFPHPVRR